MSLKYFAERRNEGRYPLDEIYADMFSVALDACLPPRENCED